MRHARIWPVFLVLLVGTFGVAALGTGFSYRPVSGELAPADSSRLEEGVSASRLRGDIRRLVEARRKREPRGDVIVIDRAHNRLRLIEEGRVVIEAKCSTGSGTLLVSGDRRWKFDTPRGVFRVLRKVEDPIWTRPDWSFVEEGKPLPKTASERVDPAALGEYALHFGNGYMIHGTLYERLLGESVTHGCVRVGRDDLRQLFASTAVGTPIYIF